MGDIHGHYKQMCACLYQCVYNPQTDKLVLLGDYVDRGPDSRPGLEKIQSLVAEGATALRGNHEVLMIRAVGRRLGNPLAEEYKLWVTVNGCDMNIKSFGYDLREMHKAIKFLAKMPIYYETEHFVFAYRAVNTNKEKGKYIPMDKQLLVWDRHMDNPQVKYNGKVVVIGQIPVQFISGDENYWERFGWTKLWAG